MSRTFLRSVWANAPNAGPLFHLLSANILKILIFIKTRVTFKSTTKFSHFSNNLPRYISHFTCVCESDTCERSPLLCSLSRCTPMNTSLSCIQQLRSRGFFHKKCDRYVGRVRNKPITTQRSENELFVRRGPFAPEWS